MPKLTLMIFGKSNQNGTDSNRTSGGGRVSRQSTAHSSFGPHFFSETENFSDVPPPTVTEPDILAATAAFVELFAQRRGQQPPTWTAEIERQDEPIFLFRCKPESNTYRLCLETAPQPLRQRGFYAPYNYLTFV